MGGRARLEEEAIGTDPPRPLIRVGVIDDHPAIYAALAAGLDSAPDLEFVGAARDGASGVELAGLVDVLLCDLHLGDGMDGLRVLQTLHRPDRLPVAAPPAVIVFSALDQPSLIRAAMDAGAVGFVHKSVEVPDVVAAIRVVAAGGTAFSADALRRSLAAPRRPSDRELEVIGGVVEGATNAEVAGRLGLSEKTVESHLRRLFDRYGVLSRTELAMLARDEGWTTSVPRQSRDPRG